jgi:hypothetical protein
MRIEEGIMQRPAGSELERGSEQSASDQIQSEVSLIDLWLVLVRRKGIFLAVFLVAVAAAAVYTFVSKPIYESRAVFEIGKVGGSLIVEEASALVRWLKEEYAVDNPGRRGDLPRLDSVEHSPKTGQNILILKTRDFSADGAHSFLKGVAGRLIERHRKLYEEARGAQEERLRDLNAETAVLQNQVNLLANLTKELDDRGQAAVVAVERGGLLGTLAKLRDQRATLALSLSAMQSFPTRLVGEPTFSQEPVKPKPALYLALGVMLGLLLGVLGAFFAEFLSRARKGVIVRQGATPPSQ